MTPGSRSVTLTDDELRRLFEGSPAPPPPPRRHGRRRFPTLVAVLRAAWLLVAWMFLLAMFALFRPPYNAVWVAGTIALALWWHVLRTGARRNRRERATLRLRPVPAWAVPLLRRAVWPLLVANIVSLLLAVAAGLPMGDANPKTLQQLQQQGPWGYAAIFLWMLAFAPLMEEMVCRGWLQHPLERRLGPAPAVALSAAVFAALHMQPAGFANRFILGAFAGFAVWVTGSLWAGVAMHAANNLLVTGLISLTQVATHGARARAKPPTPYRPGTVAVLALTAVLAVCLHSLVRIGRQMLAERRSERVRMADAARVEHFRRRTAERRGDEREGRVMSDTKAAGERPARSLRALLEGIVDYAGLFPPAALEMGDAAARYAAARRGPSAWMLGRFVVPAARLSELAAAADAHLPEAGEGEPWRLSVLAGPELAADFAAIEAFNAEHAGRAVADSVEIKATHPVALAAAARQVPEGMTAYFELPVDGELDALLEAVKSTGTRAKIRTGGVTPDAFPSPADVLRFLDACVRLDVPLKATAGLHHPLRAEHALTYADDAPRGTMFGFLNVFLAAAFLRAGVPSASVAPLLEEGDGSALRFTDDGVEWRGHRLATAQLHAARAEFAASFGSCSFDEPVTDLNALSLL